MTWLAVPPQIDASAESLGIDLPAGIASRTISGSSGTPHGEGLCQAPGIRVFGGDRTWRGPRRRGRRVGPGEIAEAQGIPERYLVQILLQLKAAGLVHSARGSDGGYQLARRPEEITAADVIGAIEGPGDPPRKMESQAARELYDLLGRARAAEHGVLAQASIARLAGLIGVDDWVL